MLRSSRVLSLLGLVLFISNAKAQDMVTNVPVVSAPISEAEVKNPKIKASMFSLVWGREIEDKYFKSVSALTYLEPRVDLMYNSWLTFDLQFAAFFATGNTKNFYTEEGKSSNGLYLEEAAANFKPFSNLDLRGGDLYIQINPIYSYMSPNPFLGAEQKYDIPLSEGNFKISLMTDEAVPSSGTVSKGILDDAPNAFFLTQSLMIESKLTAMSSVFKAGVTHFEFGNLSANVAGDSVLIGNDPRSFEGIGPNTRFTIGFGGFETAATLKTDLSRRFTTELTGLIIQNNQAPSDRNFGHEGLLAVTTKFERVNLIPSFLVFRMGADVTPAAYTILPFRYQNRDGYTAMLKVELKKEKLSFFGSYTHGDVINPSPYMADRELYNIGVESKNDIF